MSETALSMPTSDTPALEPALTSVPTQNATPTNTELKETAPEVKVETPSQKKEPLSPRFAALAKKEAKLQAEREAIKAEREKLTPLQKQIEEFETSKKNAKLNPLKALENLGLTIEEINEFYLNGEQPTESAKLSEVDRKIEEFRKEQQEKEQKVAQEAAAKLKEEHEKIVQDFKNDVFSYVESNPEKFELINLYNQKHEVINLIDGHYQATGEVMSKETASELLEKELEKLVDQATQTKKFKAKAQPQPQVEKKQESKPSISNRTISSQLTPASTGVKSIPVSTDNDRLQRAVAKYYEAIRK